MYCNVPCMSWKKVLYYSLYEVQDLPCHWVYFVYQMMYYRTLTPLLLKENITVTALLYFW